jgi:hypothetical protein
MLLRVVPLALLLGLAVRAVIIDRIAVVVGDKIIKDSDIVRDIKLVSFLNHEQPDFDLKARRVATSRLIDQTLIRREIEVGMYPAPNPSDVNKLLSQIEKSRCGTRAQCEKERAAHGLTENELKQYLSWQLTVLRFIDVRFRPGVMIADRDIENYYNEHREELRKLYPGKPDTLEALHNEIQQTLVAERVNQLFDAWLKARRQSLNVEYREASLG